MSEDVKKYLYDISTAIFHIDMHLLGKRDLDYFLTNFTARRAVEREFEIIGEAMNRILKIEPEIQITNSRAVVSLRNRVIHAYDLVDEMVLWKVITSDLPILKSEVGKLLEND